MSVDSGPNTVDNGLILNIDAANLRSWPGSGTTWYDVSGQTNTAYMYGSVPTSSDGGTCFDFATVSGGSSGSATLGFTFTSNMIPLTGSFTFSTWVKNPPSSVGQCGMFSNAGGANGYRFGIGKDACYVLMSGANAEGYSEPQIGFNSTLDSTSWYNVCMIFDRANATPQWNLYLNGVFQRTTNMGIPQNVAMANVAPGLVRSACCGLYTGKIATFVAYNLALSANEITQNFNALRGRYGV